MVLMQRMKIQILGVFLSLSATKLDKHTQTIEQFLAFIKVFSLSEK